LPHHRRRVHARRGSGHPPLAAGADGGDGNEVQLSREEKLRILGRLTDAETLETFLHKKYIGAKRFSLEGGESLIPLMDWLIEEFGERGGEEIVIGMAHRGRLNILANVLNKDLTAIFAEFEDKDAQELMGRGDVKYHLGYSSDRVTRTGKQLHLSLAFNPSHLEWVNTVVEGRVRAKQDRDEPRDPERKKVLPCSSTATRPSPGRAWWPRR